MDDSLLNAICDFFKGNDVVCYCKDHNKAVYMWGKANYFISKLSGVQFTIKRSDLSIQANGYTLRFVSRRQQLRGVRNNVIIDLY